MVDGLIAVDGKILDPDAATVSVLDRGFLFGDAIFEVMVAFGSQILDLKKHLLRLRQSAEMIELPIPWSDTELEFELQSLVDQMPYPKKYLRLVVTRGNGIGVRIPDQVSPTRITYCLKSESSALAPNEGLNVKRTLRPGSIRGAAPKTTNYLPAALALERARREGFNEILWSSPDGEVSEAHASNVFFIARDGDFVSFVTPPAQSGLLLGITRETIINLLRNAKLPVYEEVVFWDELPRFDEAFLCSTIRGIVPISRIDQQKLHTLRPQATFWHIKRLFQAWVTSQLGFPVDWDSGLPISKR